MNLKEYASRFDNPKEDFCSGEEQGKSARNTVVLAGTILSVTDRYCRVDVNGGKYELDAREVIEIEEIPAHDDKGKNGAESAEKVSPTVLITLDRTAVLCRMVPVQAALLAAAGTWMWVLAPTAEKGATEQSVM